MKTVTVKIQGLPDQEMTIEEYRHYEIMESLRRIENKIGTGYQAITFLGQGSPSNKQDTDNG